MLHPEILSTVTLDFLKQTIIPKSFNSVFFFFFFFFFFVFLFLFFFFLLFFLRFGVNYLCKRV